ncbi:hypothetical protein [Frankia sp. R82]|uniref:hypothetical protein n=1 Tax=Frankia sp. R82 TaxID=2950553 RepID=UPI002043FA79|nr:hypothetical protein [Frankia sp. R82]MCM3884170.1 hypothetical protein [Frankia sp. R82]
MTSAVGIHAHPTRKTGLRPPTRRAALRIGRYLTGVVPAHPSAADHLGHLEYGLYANDRYGDCGPTSVANLRRVVTAGLTGTMQAPSQDDVFDLYRRSGNPGFDPATGADDNGVEMQTMLQAVQAGGIGGVQSLAFAQVDVGNDDELDAAISLFGGILWGVDLEVAQQAQTDAHPPVWDYRRSGEWGGHAVLAGAYRAGRDDVITWAERVSTTAAFRRRQLQEAWVVIWPEHLGSAVFQAGVDLAALAADYQELTGRPFPTVTPAPVPVPPAPTPADDDGRALADALRTLIPAASAWLAARPTTGG